MQASDQRFIEISEKLSDFQKHSGRKIPYYYFLWPDKDALVKYLCADPATSKTIKEDICNFSQEVNASAQEMYAWAKAEERRSDAELGVQFVIDRF